MKTLRIVGLIIVMTMSLHFANAQCNHCKYFNYIPNRFFNPYGNVYFVPNHPMNNSYHVNGYVQRYVNYPVYYNAPRVLVRVNRGHLSFHQGYYRGYNNGWNGLCR